MFVALTPMFSRIAGSKRWSRALLLLLFTNFSIVRIAKHVQAIYSDSVFFLPLILFTRERESYGRLYHV